MIFHDSQYIPSIDFLKSHMENVIQEERDWLYDLIVTDRNIPCEFTWERIKNIEWTKFSITTSDPHPEDGSVVHTLNASFDITLGDAQIRRDNTGKDWSAGPGDLWIRWVRLSIDSAEWPEIFEG